ncbi:hypothetical protein PCASD_08498 [Puccinia coronata f. sp. avenae]|uniref:Uncharacterized protein n=1 Tax=Puccinia coronata f. sp. avenae TaxID=200324 RepID=A0A2N5UY22_9BASI|nr:hypothetical protein PCASD_08498 [Puccinia coronata f. sp. avenae]
MIRLLRTTIHRLTRTNTVSIRKITMGSTRDTLQVLVSMGLRLRWDERDQIGRVTEPEEDSEAKKNKAKEEEEEEEGSTILRYLKDLERRAQQVSERYLVSSLLAGPDNESDEALDVPVLLGSFPAGATLPSGGTDWVLQKLGLEHAAAAQISSAIMTVRETVQAGADASTAQASGTKPWVVTRLLGGDTDANDVQAMDADAGTLGTLIGEMRPRLSFEITLPAFPTRPVCFLVGLLPSSSSSLHHPNPSLWGGLISYRVSS